MLWHNRYGSFVIALLEPNLFLCGGDMVSTGVMKRGLRAEVDRLASLKADHKLTANEPLALAA